MKLTIIVRSSVFRLSEAGEVKCVGLPSTGSSFMPPQAAVPGDHEVSLNFALTRQSQIGAARMRRKRQTPAFDWRHGRDFTFDLDGAGTTGAQPSTMNRTCDRVVKRKSCTDEYLSQIVACLALQLAVGELNDRHGGSSSVCSGGQSPSDIAARRPVPRRVHTESRVRITGSTCLACFI